MFNLTRQSTRDENPDLWPVCFCAQNEYSAGIMIVGRTSQKPSAADSQRVRREVIAWAVATSENRRTIYLDTETTGLDGSAEIIEISAIDFQGNLLLDTFVRPQEPIPHDAEAIHGISNTMVAGGPQWPEVYAELAAILSQSATVVYNAEFDFRMVNQMNRRHNLSVRRESWQCAMQRYSGFAGVWNAYRSNYLWHKLDQAVATFGHPPGGHRALSDALACRLVVKGIAES